MQSVWWDFKGIVHFELFPRNQTINLNIYCRQLLKLDKEIKEEQPEFDSNETVKNELIQFFAPKNQTFYASGIMKLTKRWQKVIEQNGQYIID